MRTRLLALTLVTFVLPGSLRHTFADESQSSSPSLYSQSAAQAITHALAACGEHEAADPLCSERASLSYLLLDARSGSVLASDWLDSNTPIPLGSLVKPFAALAYGEKHQFRYPVHLCRGTASGCWLPRGHGRIGLQSAIANSCNSYFRMLTRDLSAMDIQPIASSFGVQLPDADDTGASLAGLGDRWTISPLAMARAYVELSRRADQPGVREILAGMAESGRSGTGAEVDRQLLHTSALVKTGTARCTHPKPAPGDGFAITMFPAGQPAILLMVRVHGTPGSHAAKVAGELLHRIEP
ncbi:MAG TPA: penicillin-binding transpeptidase domain-containing protein [Terriglobales bacterium]|nr:penicillin-binding transpeptidase domain-containing protein [Terriglobales bacterium]